jgi:hypothetical protein
MKSKWSNNILVTKEEGDGDVMIFTNLSAEVIERALRKRMNGISEVHAVPDKDIEFYVYEPLWLDEEAEQKITKEYGE